MCLSKHISRAPAPPPSCCLGPSATGGPVGSQEASSWGGWGHALHLPGMQGCVSTCGGQGESSRWAQPVPPQPYSQWLPQLLGSLLTSRPLPHIHTCPQPPCHPTPRRQVGIWPYFQ